MSQSELLTYLVQLLTDLQIPYMMTGSLVSSIQGEPRLTHDIDVVVVLSREAIKPLHQAFSQQQFYSSPSGMEDAIERQHMFNVLDSSSGNKIDFWMLTDEAFDLSRFERRSRVTLTGLGDFFITTPEDTILSKLRWAKMAGGSEKQLTDAIRVFEMQFDRLDMDYIKLWVSTLQLQTQWQQLVDQAEPY